MKIRVGSTLSENHIQYEGVPQGSVLSCSLFSLAINDIGTNLPEHVDHTLYVDDFTIFSSSANPASLERRMQIAVNRVSQWTLKRGFRFSVDKSVIMHLTKLRGFYPSPGIYLEGLLLRNVDETKYLGLTIDRKLNYESHIRKLKISCNKAMSILKCLSHRNWGSDRLSLLRIYRALIRSKLDYGCQVYDSATASNLKTLDSVHHQGIRLSIGAFRTSPVDSLYAESGEPSLSYRRKKLSLQLYARIKGMPHTPYSKIVMYDENDILFGDKKYHNTFGFRARQLFVELRMDDLNVTQTVRYMSCPWTLPMVGPCANADNLKSTTPPAILRDAHLNHVVESHSNDIAIYTDGSKRNREVGCATVLPGKTMACRLPPYSSVFTAEMHAISVALAKILSVNGNNFVIFSDSRSAIDSITNGFNRNPLAHEIHMWINILSRNNKYVKFCWVPSHVGVYGNEVADEKAKEIASSQRRVADIKIPAKDFYMMFRDVLDRRWQASWQTHTFNKLHSIKNTITPWSNALHKDRLTEVVMARIRIGHTRLTHGFLLEGTNAPLCMECIVPLTVLHILTECPEYSDQRRYIFGSDGIRSELPLRDILADSENCIRKVTEFLRLTNLLHLL